MVLKPVEVILASMDVFKREAGSLLFIALVLSLIRIFIVYALPELPPPAPDDPREIWFFLGLMMGYGSINQVCHSLITVATTATVSSQLKQGRSNLWKGVQLIALNFVPVLALTILVWPLKFVSVFLLIVPAFLLSTVLYVAVPAMVAEELRPVEAIRRSWALTQNAAWRIFALLSMFFVANAGINIGIAELGRYLSEDAHQLLFVLQFTLTGILTLLESLCIAISYYELRALEDDNSTAAHTP